MPDGAVLRDAEDMPSRADLRADLLGSVPGIAHSLQLTAFSFQPDTFNNEGIGLEADCVSCMPSLALFEVAHLSRGAAAVNSQRCKPLDRTQSTQKAPKGRK